MTTATKAGGAVLPVVAYRRYSTFTGWYYWGDDHAEPGSPNEEDLTPLAPAQATIDELRAEVERLTRERWVAIQRELDALKAKQIDVDAVMRLADAMVKAKCQEQHANRFGSLADWARYGRELDAAREALRAALLGDGGTL